MSSKTEKSIVQIYNEMNFEENFCDENINKSKNRVQNINRELYETLFNINKIKQYESIESAIQAAKKAQNQWKLSSGEERANVLYRIYKALAEKLEHNDEFHLTYDYFNDFSDLALLGKEKEDLEPVGVVLAVCSLDTPLFVFAGIVSASLAAGCSLIVQSPEKKLWLALFLANIMLEVGLPEGLLSVLSKPPENLAFSENISKIIFCGSYSSAQGIYKDSLSRSFKFLCPNQTAAVVLESSDIVAAVNKIFDETWNKNFEEFFTLSMVVVQESVYKDFLENLKFRMEQHKNDNKISAKFKNNLILKRIGKAIENASKAGAIVIKATNSENEWGPTAIVYFQDQDLEPNLPVIKILPFRTVSEGVALLNNSHSCLGVSIWTENSSTALEISSMLSSKNIWVNCHGIMETSVPLQPIGSSGNFVLGGFSGLLEFLSAKYDCSSKSEKCIEEKGSLLKQKDLSETVLAAQNAFNVWKFDKNKKKNLKLISDSLKENKELSSLSNSVNRATHMTRFEFSEGNTFEKLDVIHSRGPIGVIAIFINDVIKELDIITSLITPAILLGNAIILVLKENNNEIVSLINLYNKFLPKKVLNLVIGCPAALHLASNPNIQAVWLYGTDSLTKNIQILRNNAAKTVKNIWIIPKNPLGCQDLILKECSFTKNIWLTKVDKFP